MKSQSLNAKLKIIIIVFYTIIVFGIILLVLGTSKNQRFEEYGTKAYDSEIAVNIRETETRSSKFKTGSEEEIGEHAKSVFDFRITVVKLKSYTSIKDMRIYLAAKTTDGSYRYDEYSSSSKKMDETTYTSITTLSSFATKSFETVDEDGESVDYLFNETPEEIYVKITYKLNNEEETRTLAYKTNVLDINPSKKFDNVEERNIIEKGASVNPQYIDPKEDPVRVRLTKTKATETTILGSVKEDLLKVEFNISTINLNKLQFDEEYLKNNSLTKIELPKVTTAEDAWDVVPEIDDVKFEIWGKITSDDEEFSDYVKFYSIYGFLSTYRALSITSCKIDETLNLEEIYIIVEGSIYNGTQDSFEALYKVKYNSLPDE